MKRLLPLLWVAIVAATVWPGVAQAHQPRLVSGDNVQISNPKVSQAFYDELKGQPRIYAFKTDGQLETSIQLLVPASTNPNGRYSAEVFILENGQRLPVGKLDGMAKTWSDYYEEFANDWYAQSEAYNFRVRSGSYEIQVTGMDDRGKYVLVVGQDEVFPAAEIWNALLVVPKLKQTFFNESPLTLLFSAYGPYALIGALLLDLFFWLAVFKVLGLLLPESARRRLEPGGSWRGCAVRLLIGLSSVVLAIHFWNLAIFLLAGLVLHQAAICWGGLRASKHEPMDNGVDAIHPGTDKHETENQSQHV